VSEPKKQGRTRASPLLDLGLFQLTETVTAAVWLNEPDVPVTITVAC
jgi:hypothetical protein